MFVWPLLSIVIFAPILGGLAISMASDESGVLERNSKYTTLFTTFMTLIFSLLVMFEMNTENAGIQLEERINILPNFFINYVVGVDWVSILFIVLTTSLSFVIALINVNYTSEKTKYFSIALLLIEGFVIGAFASQNLMLFFLFFEAILIPLFILIGLRGLTKEKETAFRFALISMFSAMITLPAILIIVFRASTGYIPDLATMEFTGYIIDFVWWALFIGYAIRLPVIPLHSWYVNVLNHSTIPVALFIAVILSKVGLYALFRINVSLFPNIAFEYSNIVVILAFLTALYGLIVIIKLENLIKTVGYLAMVFVNVSLITLFLLTSKGIIASVFHALTSSIFAASLFIVYSLIEQKHNTVNIKDLGGLYKTMPRLSIFNFLITSSSLGLPLTAGFASLMLVMIATFNYSLLYGVMVVFLFTFMAGVMINMHSKVFWSLTKKADKGDVDMEAFIFMFVISFIIILVGILPNSIIQPVEQVIWSLVVSFKGVGS